MRPGQIEQKKNNLLGHLVVLREDIDLASKELSGVYVDIDKAKEQKKGLVGSIIQLNSEIREKENFIHNLTARESAVLSKEENLNTREKEIDQLHSDKLDELEEEEHLIEIEIAEKKRKLEGMDQNFASAMALYNKLIDSTTDKIARLGIEASNAEKELQKIRDLISEEKEYLNELTDLVEDAQSELDDAKESLKMTIAGKQTLINNINEREKAVSGKERDVRVITERIRKAHKRLFPERNLTI